MPADKRARQDIRTKLPNLRQREIGVCFPMLGVCLAHFYGWSRLAGFDQPKQ
jgi:hypothetical protein